MTEIDERGPESYWIDLIKASSWEKKTKGLGLNAVNSAVKDWIGIKMF